MSFEIEVKRAPPYQSALIFAQVVPLVEMGLFERLHSNETIYKLAVDPVVPTILYAEGSSMYKSTNSGATWRTLSDRSFGNGLVLDPVTPTTLYAISNFEGVLRSTDGGESWTPVSTGLPAYTSISALAINPATPLTLYAATWNGGLYKTTNGAASWSAANPPSPFDRIAALLILAADPSTLHVGTGSGVYSITFLCAAPIVTEHPVGAKLCSGQPVTLTVTATGQGLHYQWYRGSAWDTSHPVGSDSASYNATAPGGTFSYWCRVSNGCGMADSAVATVQADLPPTLTAQPRSQTINSGQAATLRVTASGTAPLQYAWYQGYSGDASQIAPGSTDAPEYVTPALSLTTRFWVRVTNDCGVKDSNTATLTMRNPGLDIDGNGEVDAVDALFMAEYLAGMLPRLPCGANCGDGNKDGTIDVLDLVEIVRACVEG